MYTIQILTFEQTVNPSEVCLVGGFSDIGEIFHRSRICRTVLINQQKQRFYTHWYIRIPEKQVYNFREYASI